MLSVSSVKVHMFTSQVHLVVSEVMTQVENFYTVGEILHIKGVNVNRFEEVCRLTRK